MLGTKITVTLGPATSSEDTINALIDAGTNTFRLNLKHSSHQWHEEWIKKIDAIRKNKNKPVAILIDIPGLDRAHEWIDMATYGVVDFMALSYIKMPEDVIKLKTEINTRNSKVKIIAKIETAQALSALEEIIHLSDGVMVARGDLGTELPIQEIPYYQKHIIKRSLELGKPVITATEMLESMIHNPQPTRAEVSDVANAMYDATDAVMLSAETAVGHFPVEAVRVMREVATYIDNKRPIPTYKYEVNNRTDALTIAANNLAKQKTIESEKISGFVVVSESGDTVRALSRLRPSIPIIAITPHEQVRNQLLLSWGVRPLVFENPHGSYDEQKHKILDHIKENGIIQGGSHVIMLYGSEAGISGNTNVIRIENI